MRKVTALTGLAALFFAAQASAVIQTYSVTFTYGADEVNVWTTSGAATPSYDPTDPYGGGGENGNSYYNADTIVPGTDYSGLSGPDCSAAAAIQEYACIGVATGFTWTAIPVIDAQNPVGGIATGNLLVDTDAGTISGTLNVAPYEFRFADGSPFVVGYRQISAAATISIFGFGAFTDTGIWNIFGGGSFFFDPGLTCTAATTFGATDLCAAIPAQGQDLSWGGFTLTNVDGAGNETGGTTDVAGLLGSAVSVNGGATVSGSGAWNAGNPSSGQSKIFWDEDNQNLEVSGSLSGGLWTLDATFVSQVPVPAAVWLFGSALGLLGWVRRRAQ